MTMLPAHARALDKDAAEAAARRINAYWRARGHEAGARVADRQFCPAKFQTLYPIVSDLVNGLPRELAERGVRNG
jgi:hypothetical protein